MSLINDALKRAKEAQPSPTRVPAAAGPMEPAPEAPRRSLPWFFFPAVLAILTGASWFLIKGWDAHRQSLVNYGSPVTIRAREVAPPTPPAPTGETAPETVATPAVAPAAAVVHSPDFIPAVNRDSSAPLSSVNRNFALDEEPSAAPAETAATPAISDTPAVPPVPVPAAGPLPTFRLQGIFFRNTSPSAMVNGKSVFVGDFVSGAQIKAIDRERVTLEYEGQTKTLTLP